MKLYSIDVRIYGTAYIKAESAEKALEIAKKMKHQALEVTDAGESDIEISGLRFDNPNLPDVSLSPAMSIHGPDEDDFPEEADD